MNLTAKFGRLIAGVIVFLVAFCMGLIGIQGLQSLGLISPRSVVSKDSSRPTMMSAYQPTQTVEEMHIGESGYVSLDAVVRQDCGYAIERHHLVAPAGIFRHSLFVKMTVSGLILQIPITNDSNEESFAYRVAWVSSVDYANHYLPIQAF